MDDLPDSVRDTIKTQAEAYARGQSAARNDLGCKARKPNFMWVDEAAFTAAAIEKGAILIGQLTELYDQMLADRTYVWRFGPGSDGSLSTRRVVCGNRSVTGGCVRPPKHGGGHSMYLIGDDPGATSIPELLARIEAQGENTAP